MPGKRRVWEVGVGMRRERAHGEGAREGEGRSIVASCACIIGPRVGVGMGVGNRRLDSRAEKDDAV